MNPTAKDIQIQFQDLLDKYNKKLITPAWFYYNVKTLLSKNLTIEDWNRAMTYIRNVSSETEVLLEMCKLFANRDSLVMEEYVKKEETNGDSTSRIDNLGTLIALAVGNNRVELTKEGFTYNGKEVANADNVNELTTNKLDKEWYSDDKSIHSIIEHNSSANSSLQLTRTKNNNKSYISISENELKIYSNADSQSNSKALKIKGDSVTINEDPIITQSQSLSYDDLLNILQ